MEKQAKKTLANIIEENKQLCEDKKFEVLKHKVFVKPKNKKNCKIEINNAKETYLINPLTGKLVFVKLYRIRALKDFGDVKAGDIGGFVTHEGCLSQQGDCWIYNNASVVNGLVEDNARVYGRATILGGTVRENAKVYGGAFVLKGSVVEGNAQIHDDAIIGNNAHISGSAYISENAKILDNSVVANFSVVCGDAIVSENSILDGNAVVRGHAKIAGDAKIRGGVIEDNVRILGNTTVFENPRIYGNVEISGESVIHGVSIVGDRNPKFKNKKILNKDIFAYQAGVKTKSIMFDTQDPNSYPEKF